MNSKRIRELNDILIKGDTDTIPKHWYNRHQVAKANKKSLVQTDKLIKKLVNARLVERKMFRVRTNSGVRPVPYFFFGVASVSATKPNPESRKR